MPLRPLPASEQRRNTGMAEDSVPKQVIQVKDAESWADRPVKVSVTEPYANGTMTQALRVTMEEAEELYDKLGAYIASKKPPREPRSDRDRAWDGAMDGGRLG